MEETGIIRRLDALGRVVIPREFRKLNRIEVGDPLEIRAKEGGEIVIRKVDLSAQLKTVGALALASLAPYTDKSLAVCSQDTWLEVSGGNGALEGEELPQAAAEAVNGQKSCVKRCNEIGIQSRNEYVAFYPVYGDTGVFGALAVFCDEQPDRSETVLMETVARFTGKSMQNF